MDGSVTDLARYRLNRANEDLVRAKREFEIEDYKLALNRSYYAIFHGLRAVNALDEFDSSKHSGVISHFNQFHVKSGDFPEDISKRVNAAMMIRQRSDYDDFFIASKTSAKEQIESAEHILQLIESFITASHNMSCDSGTKRV